VANSAAEAFEKVSPHVDLIILDLVLPDSHGFEVCRRLRSDEDTRHIPIIMLSAYTLYEDKVQGLYLGADDFLPKPCEHEELFARIEVVMRRSHGRDRMLCQKNHERIICELRNILDQSLIMPHYQPIYLLNPFQLYGVEVLTRPTIEGPLSNPEDFFKAALQYGLYSDLEMLSWSKALAQLSQKISEEKVFLNCSPYFIESSQFLRVKALIEKTQLFPANVILEITERSAITNYKLFYEHLNVFRDYGFRIAVDDVGGGYASLQSIVETEPNVVKIDRQFIASLRDNSYKRSIVKLIVNFCKENNILSIAEGIENETDLEMVRSLQVDAGQGYYFCRPTPEIDFGKFSAVKH
jgi:EAL domain-containing protein (putative c-di-GMP-specific phosphodiesterase class I)